MKANAVFCCILFFTRRESRECVVCCLLCCYVLVLVSLVQLGTETLNLPDSWKQASHSTEFYTERVEKLLVNLFLHPSHSQEGFELKFYILRIIILR